RGGGGRGAGGPAGGWGGGAGGGGPPGRDARQDQEDRCDRAAGSHEDTLPSPDTAFKDEGSWLDLPNRGMVQLSPGGAARFCARDQGREGAMARSESGNDPKLQAWRA